MNVRKHAQATKVKVKMAFRSGVLSLTIKDNGVGFDLKNAVRKPTGHYGLLFMQERASLAEGKVEIQSKPGKGNNFEGFF